MTNQTNKALISSYFQPYSYVRKLLPILEGVTKAKVIGMMTAIWEQTGTPQNPLDWSDPDTWISERLTGEDVEMARSIWERSQKTVNPRYVSDSYRFIDNCELLIPDNTGIYRLTERGKGFLDNDPKIIREIDDSEGLLYLLSILAAKTRAKRNDPLPEWEAFLI